MKSPAYSAFLHPHYGKTAFYKHTTGAVFFSTTIIPHKFACYPEFRAAGYGYTPLNYYADTVKPNLLFTAQSRNDLIGKCSHKYLFKHHPEALL